MNIETVWSWFEEEMSVMINMNRNIEQNIGLRPLFLRPLFLSPISPVIGFAAAGNRGLP